LVGGTGVFVAVLVGAGVEVPIAVLVAVLVGVFVAVLVDVLVGVLVGGVVGVFVGGTGVIVGVADAVGVGAATVHFRLANWEVSPRASVAVAVRHVPTGSAIGMVKLPSAPAVPVAR
jgi:hypothetical protein